MVKSFADRIIRYHRFIFKLMQRIYPLAHTHARNVGRIFIRTIGRVHKMSDANRIIRYGRIRSRRKVIPTSPPKRKHALIRNSTIGRWRRFVGASELAINSSAEDHSRSRCRDDAGGGKSPYGQYRRLGGGISLIPRGSSRARVELKFGAAVNNIERQYHGKDNGDPNRSCFPNHQTKLNRRRKIPAIVQ